MATWFPPGWFPGGGSGGVGTATGIGSIGVVTAGQIINLALRRITALDPDQNIDPTEQTNALTTLDFILKELAAQGLSVIIRDTVFLFIPNKNQQFVDNRAGLLTSSHLTTTTTASAAQGSLSINVTTPSNFTSGDYILIKMANGHLHFTTVNGSPSGSSVPLNTALVSAVNSGAYVYNYPANQAVTSSLVAVDNVARLTTTTDTLTTDEGGYSVEISLIGDTAYQSLPNKVQSGLTTQVYARNFPTYVEFYLWPVGDTSFDRLSMSVLYYFADLANQSTTLWIPPHALNAVAWQLAAEISTEYDLPEVTQKKLWQVAGGKITQLLDFVGQEESSIFFVNDPNRQMSV